MRNNSIKVFFEKGFFLAIILVGIFGYWLYLVFVTQPILVHDAKGYQDLGVLIHDEGWKTYFSTGPNREPLYPALIALAMKLGGLESYQTILKLFQIFLLSGAVFMAFILMSECQIAPGIKFFALVYLGFSPAFVNSALSIYSEIVTYTPILGIVFVSIKAWRSLTQKSAGGCFGWGCLMGACFVGITFCKGIYEMIFPLFLSAFVFLVYKSGAWKKRGVFYRSMVFLFAAILVFGVCITGYKALNKKYNGIFALTDRGSWALYGNTARRQEPLTGQRFLAGVAYNLLEEDDCAALLDRGSCHFWDVATSDDFASEKNYQVIRDFPREEHSRQFAKLILEKILENPLQYILLAPLDWVHMFFWESTRIGFVAYPDWLDKIFDNAIFAKSLRLGAGLFSLGAVLLGGFYFCRQKVWVSLAQKSEDVFGAGLYFLGCLIVCHITLYSLFATVARFALPIAPLFILMIAFCAQILFYRKLSEGGKTDG